MNALIVRPEAEADIDEAYSWYSTRSVGLGYEYLNAIDTAFQSIADNPLRYPIVHVDPTMPVRRALTKRFPYGIYFLWDGPNSTVVVIACMHARQEPRRWLRRVR